MTFTQAEHKLLMIPGPIEVADDVLYANAHPAMAHVSPDFVPVFGKVLTMLKKVVYAPNAQPFVVAGSGTLGWDMVGANVLQQKDEVLVLHAGYFADSFADCLSVYGATATQLKAPVGSSPSVDEVKRALKEKKYRAITITHVDTSTGVLTDVKKVAAAVQEVSPETLVIVDAVCSVASEELRMEDWGVDVVITGSQKGLGCPPGATIVLAGPRAIKAYESRSSPVPSYYLSWSNLRPVMQAYEKGSPAYFGTPPTNLIYALNQSLTTITEGKVSLEERFKLHKDASHKVKDFLKEHGVKQLVPEDWKEFSCAANGMTAVRYPGNLKAADVLPKMSQRGIILGAGLHKECKDEYFRIGHMGVSVVDPSRHDVDKVLTALKEVFVEGGYTK